MALMLLNYSSLVVFLCNVMIKFYYLYPLLFMWLSNICKGKKKKEKEAEEPSWPCKVATLFQFINKRHLTNKNSGILASLIKALNLLFLLFLLEECPWIHWRIWYPTLQDKTRDGNILVILDPMESHWYKFTHYIIRFKIISDLKIVFVLIFFMHWVFVKI